MQGTTPAVYVWAWIQTLTWPETATANDQGVTWFELYINFQFPPMHGAGTPSGTGTSSKDKTQRARIPPTRGKGDSAPPSETKKRINHGRNPASNSPGTHKTDGN